MKTPFDDSVDEDPDSEKKESFWSKVTTVVGVAILTMMVLYELAIDDWDDDPHPVEFDEDRDNSLLGNWFGLKPLFAFIWMIFRAVKNGRMDEPEVAEKHLVS